MEHIVELLDAFTKVNGASGNEEEVAELLKKYLAPITDENYTDTLGNIVFIKKGKNPDRKIMFATHMDEIGFMISDITEHGFLTIVPIGFHNPNILVNQVVSIKTDSGMVYGVTGGGKPIHQTMGKESADFGFQDILIDVGAENEEEVANLGIKIGDIAYMEKESHVLNGKYYSGKAVDNRSSVVTLILMMEALKDVETEATIYAVGTVQEEIGLKGAKVITRSINPDVAICIDVGLATEKGELNPGAARCYLGKGPAIEFYDWNPDDCIGNIVSRKMVKMMEEAADMEHIPYQHSIMIRCGTDACEMTYTNQGILTGGISLPERYIHTTIGVVALSDIANAAKLGESFVRNFDKITEKYIVR